MVFGTLKVLVTSKISNLGFTKRQYVNNSAYAGGGWTMLNNSYDDPLPDQNPNRTVYGPSGNYALGGRIMLSAIVVLFFVVIVMLLLHLYLRWYFFRNRRRRNYLRRNRHNRRTHLVFYFDNNAPTASRGLDPSVLQALPVFAYSKTDGADAPECAVCLSEFEEGESGRILPKCKHSFHVACIDMWFHSHSTCPLCRSPVEPVRAGSPEQQEEISISFPDPEQFDTGARSGGLCDSCVYEEAQVGRAVGSSSGSSGKPVEPVGVSIEIPRRSPSEFGDELCGDSPPTQFKSPLSRMLSLRRILSRERRGLSPAQSPRPGSVAAVTEEVDIERGEGGESEKFELTRDLTQ